MKRTVQFLALLVLLVLVALVYQRYRVENDPLEKTFESGDATVFPDGFYKGSSPSVPVGNWQGKRFDAKAKTGANVFLENGVQVEHYPLTMYVTKGARNPEMDVIKVDYDRAENPWYLRMFAFDEIVHLSDGRYLGKIQLKLGPSVFTIGYFWQEPSK